MTLGGQKMKQSKPRLQIIRGLPGSGKTTLALRRYSHLMRLETDMFFYSRGAYRFTMERNHDAVEWFKEEVRRLCATGMDFVVTGVFAAHTERLDFVIAAGLARRYDVYIKTLTSQHKGVHAVPEEHFKAMKAAFVPHAELCEKYAEYPHVHFGLMPTKYPLEHLKRRNRKTT